MGLLKNHRFSKPSRSGFSCNKQKKQSIMKKDEFIKRCKECRDGFLSDNIIEKAVEQLYNVKVLSEDGRDDNLDIYAVMGLLFQKCADYSLHGSTNESTTRRQRKEAKNFSRFIGGRVANRR